MKKSAELGAVRGVKVSGSGPASSANSRSSSRSVGDNGAPSMPPLPIPRLPESTKAKAPLSPGGSPKLTPAVLEGRKRGGVVRLVLRRRILIGGLLREEEDQFVEVDHPLTVSQWHPLGSLPSRIYPFPSSDAPISFSGSFLWWFSIPPLISRCLSPLSPLSRMEGRVVFVV
jgi:hypothetical protein